MDVTALKRIMKPTVKKSKTVYLNSYLENEDSVTISYTIKGQKESHLKVDNEIWQGMEFKKSDGKIMITNLNGLKMITNDNGWSRLITEDQEDSEDE